MATKGRKKGSPKFGGRVKGTPNKINKDIKEVYKQFIDDNIDDVQEIYDRLKITNPLEALKFITSLNEYYMPKLARTELTGKDGDELKINIVTEDKTANEIINKI